MRRSISLLLLVSIIWSCNQRNSTNSETTHPMDNEGEQTPKCELDNSKFFSEFIGSKTSIDKHEEKLVELDSIDKQKFLSNIQRALYGRSYYVNSFELQNSSAVSIFYFGDDYSGITIFTLDSDCKIIDRMEVAGGHCGGLYEDKNGLFRFCDDRIFYKPTNNEFTLNVIKDAAESPKEGSKEFIDTITYKITINTDLKFKTEYIDSVRFETTL